METVEFLFGPNPGEPSKPLRLIASGGELARIMLAMKNVLSEQDKVSTLVFDEVDTGVSGRAAQKVAERWPVSAAASRCCVLPICPNWPPWPTLISPWKRESGTGAPIRLSLIHI